MAGYINFMPATAPTPQFLIPNPNLPTLTPAFPLRFQVMARRLLHQLPDPHHGTDAQKRPFFIGSRNHPRKHLS